MRLRRRGVLKSGGMSRGPSSQADIRVISFARDLGVEVSAAQLERWRRAGALPRNDRRGLGRGAGSVSMPSIESMKIAVALGRAAERGRPLHVTVLRAFTAAPGAECYFFVAVPRPPLPEQAVRAALAWFIRSRVVSLDRRIERAVATAASDDDAEDIAQELAERHYRRVYLADRRDFSRDILTQGRRLTRQQAQGSAVFAVASFLGRDAVGSDRLAEAFRDSWGYAGKYDDQSEELIRLIAAEGAKRELAGQSIDDLYGADLKHTVDIDTQAIYQVDFAAICNVRDVLVLLAEAVTTYWIYKDDYSDDPMISRLVDFFSSSIHTHVWIRAAAILAYTSHDYCWKWITEMIVMICCDPDNLSSFKEMARRIDFTQNDIEALVGRAAERPCVDPNHVLWLPDRRRSKRAGRY